MKVCYLAHPVAGDVADNMNRARQWLRYLIDTQPEIAFCAPWLPYLDVLDEDNPAHRERGMRDDLAIAERCDGIVLCGGRISSGMRRELDAIAALNGFAVDLTMCGAMPPWLARDVAMADDQRNAAEIAALFAQALRMIP